MLSAIGAPDAIAATINSFPTMAASPIAGTDVASWININGTAPDLVSSPGTASPVFTDDWNRNVHSARLLGKAFAHFTNDLETYDKVRVNHVAAAGTFRADQERLRALGESGPDGRRETGVIRSPVRANSAA